MLVTSSHSSHLPISCSPIGLREKITTLFERVWHSVKALFCCPAREPRYIYAFSQQSNADCHLQMWVNFERLQAFRGDHPGGPLVIPDQEYRSHRQWLGRGFTGYTQWLHAKEEPAVRRYLEEGVSAAPIYPRFFDAKGKNFFESSWNPIELGVRKSFAPYFMKEASDNEFSYIVPTYQEGERYYAYDQGSSNYECVDRSHIEGLQKIPGRSAFFKRRDSSIAVFGKFVPREIGTYKLQLLQFGLDSHHRPITLDHPEYEVTCALQRSMQAIGSVWSREVCRKEHLVECAIADLFKENPALFAKVARHVDFYFKGWALYDQELQQLYDEEGQSLSRKQLERYLPGKEQMLAFYLMKDVQYLWLAAMKGDAFCQHLALPAWMQYLPGIIGPRQYSKAAYLKDEDNQSFMDIWREVQGQLIRRFPEKKDWVSFSGHGMVISFDSDLTAQQNEGRIANRKLANDLAITGIDSLHGKMLDLFYRKRV